MALLPLFRGTASGAPPQRVHGRLGWFHVPCLGRDGYRSFVGLPGRWWDVHRELSADFLRRQVVETANWLESGRYGRSVAGNIIGGTLLSELLYRMRSRIANVQPAAQR